VFSINWNDPQTFWLNVTNLALGVVVLICMLVMAVGIAQELYARARKRATQPTAIDSARRAADDHVYITPELGLTMADGGEPLSPTPRRKH
jgi:ABC-type lipoprotein release transport system permease subunit